MSTSLSLTDRLFNGFTNETSSRHNQTTTQPNSRVVDDISVILLLYLMIFIIGSVGNLLVIYIIGRFSEVRVQSVANYYIWNLAFADLFLICTLPFSWYATYAGNWPFGDGACKISFVIREGNKFVGVYTLVALSLDRYTASYYSLNNLRTLSVGKGVCTSVWICSIVLTTPYWLYARTEAFQPDIRKCRLMWPVPKQEEIITVKSWTYFQFVIGFLLPFCLIFAAYVALGVRLRMMLSRGSRLAVKRPGRLMTRMTIIISLTFLFTQLPFYVMQLVNHAKGEEYKMRRPQQISQDEMRAYVMLTACANILIFVSSCCNPIIYGLLNKNYRKLYAEALCCCCQKVYPYEGVIIPELSSRRKKATVSHFSKHGQWTTSLLPQNIELKELSRHEL